MNTEKEFLKNYNIEAYERPSLTCDIAAFMIRSLSERSYRKDPGNSLSLLLIRRGEHPFKGKWALPGGFIRPGETVEECAYREISEETGVMPTALMHAGIFSDPMRDPRGWVISSSFVSVITEESVKAVGGDDAEDADWFDVSFEKSDNGEYILTLKNSSDKITSVLKENKRCFGKSYFDIISSGGLSFDHASIIATALSALRNDVVNYEIMFDFLPEKFTLTSLQRVQETILNISILPANFRRKISEYVEETDEYTEGAGHRPAKLYRRKKG